LKESAKIRLNWVKLGFLVHLWGDVGIWAKKWGLVCQYARHGQNRQEETSKHKHKHKLT